MLYNLLLLGGVRHRLQLIYLSWMTAMLAYGLGWTGLIHYVAPGMATADVTQFTYFVAAAGMAMGVIFFVEFFSEGDRQRVGLGKGVSVRVIRGGRRIIKTKKSKNR